MSGREDVPKTFIALLVFTLVVAANAFGGPSVKTVDTTQLHSMIVDDAYRLEAGRQRQFTVVDARTKEEYDIAHILGAINIPEEDFDKSTDLLPTDKSRLIVVYCGDMKLGTSKKWADKATNAGYMNIVIYSDRFQVWEKSKLPIGPLTESIGKH